MSDLKPLTREELDALEPEVQSPGHAGIISYETMGRLIAMARASLAPKGWPDEESLEALGEYLLDLRTSEDDADWNGIDRALGNLEDWHDRLKARLHHAAPQAEPAALSEDVEKGLEGMARRYIQDREFVQPGNVITLDFFQAVETYAAGYKAALARQPKLPSREPWPTRDEFKDWAKHLDSDGYFGALDAYDYLSKWGGTRLPGDV